MQLTQFNLQLKAENKPKIQQVYFIYIHTHTPQIAHFCTKALQSWAYANIICFLLSNMTGLTGFVICSWVYCRPITLQKFFLTSAFILFFVFWPHPWQCSGVTLGCVQGKPLCSLCPPTFILILKVHSASECCSQYPVSIQALLLWIGCG